MFDEDFSGTFRKCPAQDSVVYKVTRASCQGSERAAGVWSAIELLLDLGQDGISSLPSHALLPNTMGLDTLFVKVWQQAMVTQLPVGCWMLAGPSLLLTTTRCRSHDLTVDKGWRIQICISMLLVLSTGFGERVTVCNHGVPASGFYWSMASPMPRRLDCLRVLRVQTNTKRYIQRKNSGKSCVYQRACSP